VITSDLYNKSVQGTSEGKYILFQFIAIFFHIPEELQNFNQIPH